MGGALRAGLAQYVGCILHRTHGTREIRTSRLFGGGKRRRWDCDLRLKSPDSWETKSSTYNRAIESGCRERNGSVVLLFKAVEGCKMLTCYPGVCSYSSWQMMSYRHEPSSASGEVEKVENNASDEGMVVGLALEDAERRPLSKSALKHELKRKRHMENKFQRKALEKERKLQQFVKKQQEWQFKLANLSEKELEAIRQTVREASNAHKEARNVRRHKLQEAMQSGQRSIVIDMEFCELMASKQLNSLMQQVKLSYGANARAASPCHLWLTGCTGVIQKKLDEVSGSNQWLLSKEVGCWWEVFAARKTDLVYLTPDSENLLSTMDPTKIYIVGGLVDRNQWRRASLEKAEMHGIAHMKLPIGEHLKMLTSQVLTVNQVVEILLLYSELGEWGKALSRVIPQRKKEAEAGHFKINSEQSNLLENMGPIASKSSAHECSNIEAPQGKDFTSTQGLSKSEHPGKPAWSELDGS